ncbi:hypothetical protein BC826DRAFT_967048 [Russula brevipes]|nr:hypothetical protein BC826DRAFT_967048 [Russula brevipes]
MQFRPSNKTFKDPSPSSGKPSTGGSQTQTSSQTTIRTSASISIPRTQIEKKLVATRLAPTASGGAGAGGLSLDTNNALDFLPRWEYPSSLICLMLPINRQVERTLLPEVADQGFHARVRILSRMAPMAVTVSAQFVHGPTCRLADMKDDASLVVAYQNNGNNIVTPNMASSMLVPRVYREVGKNRGTMVQGYYRFPAETASRIMYSSMIRWDREISDGRFDSRAHRPDMSADPITGRRQLENAGSEEKVICGRTKVYLIAVIPEYTKYCCGNNILGWQAVVLGLTNNGLIHGVTVESGQAKDGHTLGRSPLVQLKVAQLTRILGYRTEIDCSLAPHAASQASPPRAPHTDETSGSRPGRHRFIHFHGSTWWFQDIPLTSHWLIDEFTVPSIARGEELGTRMGVETNQCISDMCWVISRGPAFGIHGCMEPDATVKPPGARLGAQSEAT